MKSIEYQNNIKVDYTEVFEAVENRNGSKAIEIEVNYSICTIDTNQLICSGKKVIITNPFKAYNQENFNTFCQLIENGVYHNILRKFFIREIKRNRKVIKAFFTKKETETEKELFLNHLEKLSDTKYKTFDFS